MGLTGDGTSMGTGRWTRNGPPPESASPASLPSRRPFLDSSVQLQFERQLVSLASGAPRRLRSWGKRWAQALWTDSSGAFRSIQLP